MPITANSDIQKTSRFGERFFVSWFESFAALFLAFCRNLWYNYKLINYAKEKGMTFYSPEFIFIFLPCIVVLYALAGKKLRNAVLFLGSIVFYWLASRDLMAMAILASSLLFNYAAGLFIGIAEGRMRKLLFAFCTLVNASALLSPKIIS